MKSIRTTVIYSIAIVSIFTSCLKHKTIEPTEPLVVYTCTDTVSFSNEILPEILTPSCNTTGCHNSTSAAAGYDLTTHTNDSINANIILSTMNYDMGVKAMPLGAPKMHDSLINKFKCWIDQGRLNN